VTDRHGRSSLDKGMTRGFPVQIEKIVQNAMPADLISSIRQASDRRVRFFCVNCSAHRHIPAATAKMVNGRYEGEIRIHQHHICVAVPAQRAACCEGAQRHIGDTAAPHISTLLAHIPSRRATKSDGIAAD